MNSAQPFMHQCRMTRSELQRLLADSGYGANTFIFNCYFVPETQPPLCSVCNRAIGEHDDSSPTASPMQQQPQPFMGTAVPPPTAQAYFGTGITTTLLMGGPQMGGEEIGPPENLVVGSDGVDKAGAGFMCAFVFVGGFLLVICAGLLIAFGASGLLTTAPIVCIGPCITGFMGFIFLAINNRSWIEFDRNQREVRYGSRWLLGCGSNGKCSFSQLGEVTESPTGVRVNGQPQFKIDVHLAGTEVTVEKYLGFYFGGTSKVLRWKKYIAELKSLQTTQANYVNGVVDRF